MPNVLLPIPTARKGLLPTPKNIQKPAKVKIIYIIVKLLINNAQL